MKTITAQEAMKLLEEAEKLPGAERRRLQQERLRELVAYVRERSPYFARHYRNIPEDFKLSDLPPTGKAELISQYEDWVTDREVRYGDVLRYLEEGEHKSQFLGRYTALETSGTTGVPMPMLRDSHRNVIHGAMVSRRLLGEEGVEMMDIRKHRRAAVVFANPGASAYSGFLRVRKANPGYENNIIAVSTTEPPETIIRKVNAFQPEVLSGYPSSLALLAVAKKEGRLDIPVKMIASSAEVLTEEIYALLRDAFGCRIVNNYCSTEGGEAAMASHCPHLHINEDWVIIEPVDGDGNPVTEEGVWSEGIYVTDLANYIQPIIRYYMSDRVRIHSADDGCGNPFPWMEIQGRAGGLFRFCGRQFMIITLINITDSRALEVQFIQRGEREMELRLIPVPGADRQAVLEAVGSAFTQYLEREGCRDYRITLSQEDPIKNKRGGKQSVYLKLYDE